MNDVKINNAELSPRQAAASSVRPSVSDGGSAVQEKASQQQQLLEARETERSQKVAEQAEDQALEVKEAVTKLNDYIQTVQRDLQFNLDSASGKTVITVIDSNTSEVVRQIPDEVAIKLAQGLQQDEPLSLFNVKI